jgi:hypothetical protein
MPKSAISVADDDPRETSKAGYEALNWTFHSAPFRNNLDVPPTEISVLKCRS